MLNYIIITYTKGCIKLAMLTSQGSSRFNVPDYNRAISISLPYIVPQSGFIWAGYRFHGWGDTGQTPKIYINGKYFYGGYESSHANGGAVCFPVEKGDYIGLSEYISYSFYFIPVKQ